MMGQSSKFSFPIPGRKHSASTKDKPHARPQSVIPRSKAQRILGTDGDLNIDSPSRNGDPVWTHPGSRSSGMSISISESTLSTRSINEDGSGSCSEPLDHESAVLQKSRLRGRPSSTILGQSYGEDGETDTTSVSRYMSHKDSSSTLKSYYDRQKSPLAISQQTSESSTRDLALRKGYPPVIRSPLLHIESSVDPFQELFAASIHDSDLTGDKSSRKKPTRLDLSMLFPSRKRGSRISDTASPSRSPSSMSTNTSHTTEGQNPTSGSRRLLKALSKESLRSQQHSIRSTKSHDPREHRQATDTLCPRYDNSEQFPARSPRMSQIPESRVPDRGTQAPKNGIHARLQKANPARTTGERCEISPRSERLKPKNRELLSPAGKNTISAGKKELPTQFKMVGDDYLSGTERESYAWKNVPDIMGSSSWEISSAASVSSRTSKPSRHTSMSAFSNSNLKQNSVLSLSSDSEGETSDPEPVNSPGASSNEKALRVLSGTSSSEWRRQSSQQPERPSPKKHALRKSAAQTTPFLTVPEYSATSSRLSGPWAPPKAEDRSAVGARSADGRDRRSSKRSSSITSRQSSNQPTPPQSPTSGEFRETSTRSGRFMAVTKQEEALLEALRQKRARMRKEIIEEHETAKSPPQPPERTSSRYSVASSANTMRGGEAPNDKHQILLYLDAPINENHRIDTAEPSPDLSDFLSFGSDDEVTPRSSWIPPVKGQPRPDSSPVSPESSPASPDPKSDKSSPITPPSAARLSAVGAAVGFRNQRAVDRSLVGKKRNANAGVRFVDDGKLVNADEFLLDEDGMDFTWAM